jgi:hypothetical protein
VSKILSYHWTSDQEKLEAFVLNKIEKKERALLAAHLEKCEDCSRKVQEERELLAGIRRFGRAEMKRRLRMRTRRDQGRRFEWIHAASIAAAIVVMLGAAFAVRWFINIEQKTKTREIILSENKESKPGERALWIIGRIVEVKAKPAGGLPAEKENRSLADRIEKQSEKVKGETIAQEMTSSQTAGLKEETSGTAQRRADTAGPVAYEPVRTDAFKSRASSQEKAKNYPQSISISRSQTNESRRALSLPLGARESRISDAEKKKAQPTPAAYDRLKLPAADSNKAKRSGESAGLMKSETSTAPQITAKTRQPLMAEEKPVLHSEYSAKREMRPAANRGRSIKNIVVRKGDMNDLPASMRTRDASAVHTRLEKTREGMVLTFYSDIIKDSVATSIEAVAPDSIIVTFSNKQIEYHIPGGLGGKM